MLMPGHFHSEFDKHVCYTHVRRIWQPNPLFIGQHAWLIMSANENACMCNQGYSAFSASLLFLFLHRSHSIITRGNPPDHRQDCLGK